MQDVGHACDLHWSPPKHPIGFHSTRYDASTHVERAHRALVCAASLHASFGLVVTPSMGRMIAALAVGGGVIVALVVSIIIYAACSSSHKPKAN